MWMLVDYDDRANFSEFKEKIPEQKCLRKYSIYGMIPAVTKKNTLTAKVEGTFPSNN